MLSLSNLISGQSGINSAQLVADLVAVSREPREKALTQQQQLNTARISALGTASSSLSTFVDALSGLLDGRRFAGELVSSDASVATAAFLPGAVPQGLPASVEVRQLASEQKLISNTFAAETAPVGTGQLTITTSAGAFDVVVEDANNSLAGLRDAINASGADVQASLASDNRGTRLVIAGRQGAGEEFTITPPPTPLFGSPSPLAAFAYPPVNNTGMSAIAQASDSIVRIDGVEFVNGSNILDKAIPGVQLNLLTARPGSTVTITASAPPTTTRALVEEFVDAFNVMKKALNTASAAGAEGTPGGPLAGDRAVRDMAKKLGRISAQPLAAEGPFRTLADVGVRTTRDGTLELDAGTFEKALARDPDAIARMLDPVAPSAQNPGLAGTMETVRTALLDSNGPLALAKKRYADVSQTLAAKRAQLEADMERYESSLRQTYTAMDRQLTVLRQTQRYVEQQVSVWTNDTGN